MAGCVLISACRDSCESDKAVDATAYGFEPDEAVVSRPSFVNDVGGGISSAASEIEALTSRRSA
jgi:hypothetical protein